jgi:hypothetical protein
VSNKKGKVNVKSCHNGLEAGLPKRYMKDAKGAMLGPYNQLEVKINKRLKKLIFLKRIAVEDIVTNKPQSQTSNNKGATTLSIKTLSIMELFATLSINETKHNNTAINYAECYYAECRYAECHCAECCNAECRYAECHYAERRYAECRRATIRPTVSLC